jgi:SOS-response transcriptional repressor LexA
MLAIMHNASPLGKCLLHHPVHYLARMGSPAERLKKAREAAGFPSAKAAAEAMGVSVATYIQHENGTRGFPADRAERYARFFRTQPEWLLYGKVRNSGGASFTELGPQIPIQGAVAGGVWRERMEYPEDEWTSFTGKPRVDAPLSQRFGLVVEGDSMDQLYPPGTILECVRYWGDEPIPNGRRVIVQRTRDDGTVEATVKEYFEDDDGVIWLIPRSNNPAFQAPFRCDQPESGVTDIRVVAIVIASTRYE